MQNFILIIVMDSVGKDKFLCARKEKYHVSVLEMSSRPS